jgi:hypothetical protein
MKQLILSALCLVPFIGIGQTLLYNDGAMIKVQPGATLYVEGGIHNTASGTIDNDGTIEIKGNFINEGMWEATEANTIKFSGNSHSNVSPGSAVFYNVVVEKAATFNVNLATQMTATGHMTVNNQLNFNSPGASKLVLGDFDLTLGGSATAIGYDSDEYVMTSGTGTMNKLYTSNTSFEFPVGFDDMTYNPATINKTAGPNETYSVRVLDSPTDGDGLTGTPIAADVVDAVWDINEMTPGGNTVNITLGWAESDELPGFNDALNAVSKNSGDGNGWDALFTDLGPEVANTRTRTGVTSLSAFAVGAKPLANTLYVNAKVFLEGPYSGGMMGDALRVGGHIPPVEPYSAAPFSYLHKAYGGTESVSSTAIFNQPADGDDVVDWVVVELRNSGTPTQILATKTGLLQRDGNIVDLDGVSQLGVQGIADGSYFVGIRHRNHLGVRSNATYALSNSPGPLVDFTVVGTTFDDPAVTNPINPQKTLSGGALGLYAGDASFNGVILFNGGGSDKDVVLATVGLLTPGNSVPGYNRADCNMNGITLFNGGGSDKDVILGNVGLLTPGNSLVAHNNN